MPKSGYGFMGGLVNGWQIGDELATNEARRKRDDIERQRAEGQLSDEKKARNLRDAREAAVRDSMQPAPSQSAAPAQAGFVQGDPSQDYDPQPFDEKLPPGGTAAAGAGPALGITQPTAAPAPAPVVRPFDAMISAAGKRLAAGDVEGYTDLINKGTAAKTLYYTTAFNDAYRRGDVDGMVGLLNEFPDGNKYSVQAGPNGGLTATLTKPDGTVIGSKSFADTRELGAFIQQQINPQDIAKTVRDDLELKSKLAVANANVNQSNAAADASRFQVDRGRTLLPGEVKQQAAQTNATNAAAGASSAAADAARAEAGLRRAQLPTAGMGETGKRLNDLLGARDASGNPLFTTDEIKAVATGTAKGKAREESITKIATELAKEPVNAGLKPEELVARATTIVDGAAAAAGTARVGSGPGMSRPAQGNYPQMPTDKSQLKAGQVYMTVKGPAKWNGQAFEKQ